MWKKDEPQSLPRPQPGSPTPAPAAGRRAVEATIGATVKIKGELSGDEDLLVLGRIEGKIDLPKNRVTIGKGGHVQADVRAKSIRVEGEVKGDLVGEDEVVVSASGRVRGNIVAPRVALDSGARFRGSIDMESAADRGARTQAKRGSEVAPARDRVGGSAAPAKG